MNPKDYHNVTSILLDHDTIWTPDIVNTIFTEVEHEKIVKRDVKILISYDGYIKYSVPNKMFVPTIYNLKDYPFDSQILKFRLGSWSHTHDQLKLKLKMNLILLM